MSKIKSLYILSSVTVLSSLNIVSARNPKPNILFVISDDQSYSYEATDGKKMAQTPGYDFVAKHGIEFHNAFVTSPGSSPSRASMLTGRFPWSVEQAGTHASSFPSQYICFPDVLQKQGYHIGFTGKGWGPGNWEVSGRTQNPAGPEYNAYKLIPPFTRISDKDYVANFEYFLSKKSESQPFCFWFGAHEPHRVFEKDAWVKAGKMLNEAIVPPFLPEVDVVKGDILDYIVEIEYYDSHLVKMIQLLKERGELDNTIIVVTSDNGMAFPHAKSNLYESGIHVPLAICWGSKIPEAKVTDELFSMVNIAPTLLEACEVKMEGDNAEQGKSFWKQIASKSKFKGEKAVFSGRERHSSARFNNQGYPMRAIRTNRYLLIRNFHPDRYPAGDPFMLNNENQIDKTKFIYADIDDSPTKRFLIENSDDRKLERFYNAAVLKRPEYELYDILKDPGCMVNLATIKHHQRTLKKLARNLNEKLKSTGDPRASDHPEIWESYPRLDGPERVFPYSK